MKKNILLVIIIIFLVSTYSFAAGSLQQGNSDPANLVIHYPKTWSNIGVWDFSDAEIKETAVITKIKITFDSFSSLVDQEYKGLNFYLQNQTDEIAKLRFKDEKTAITKEFNGETPAQNWNLRYFIRELKHEGSYFALTPKLTIYYEFDY